MAATVSRVRLVVSSLILFALLLVLLLVVQRRVERAIQQPVAATAPAQAEAQAHAREVAVESGAIDGAGYRIDMPKDWNRGLIVFFHGYVFEPLQLAPYGQLGPALQQFVDRGYAVAQSSYSATGWAIEQAAADSEQLRSYFVEKYGKPDAAFAVGMSMGGMLVVHALETFPEDYAGGLSLCGAIESSDHLLARDFLLISAFEFYFPDQAGQPWSGSMTVATADVAERQIEKALAANPSATQALLRWWGVGDRHTLAGILSFDYLEIAELQTRAGGNPFDTENYIYTGSGDDHALNAGVKRHAADAAAASYLQRWYTPSGKLTRPLVALHTTGDPLVPASTAFDYALAVRRAGHADSFVQQFVNRDGHCLFTTEEVGHAFDELLAWTRRGERPQAGALR